MKPSPPIPRGDEFSNSRHQRPGSGWKQVGDACWDHTSGLRIHVMGLARLPNGSIAKGLDWPEVKTLDRLIAINGGNRKRGVMAWGLGLLE